MKFSILSSALLASAMTQVQAQQKMRRGGIVGVRNLEEFDGVSLSMSMSMPAELASVELDTADVEAKAASDTAFYKSKSSKSPKSEKTGACDYRLEILLSELTDIGIDDLVEEDINDLCHYQPDGLYPGLPYGPNFGCALGYLPILGPSPPILLPEDANWSLGRKDWWLSLPFGIDPDEADVYAALEMYCECHVGIDDGCAAKVTRRGDDLIFHDEKYAAKEWVEYCKFAGIWNGDFSIDTTVLTEEVEECGCYFISQARDMIDSCPGVNLGEFFCDAVGVNCN